MTDEEKRHNADRVSFLLEDSTFSYVVSPNFIYVPVICTNYTFSSSQTIDYATRQKFGIYQNPIIAASMENAWFEGKQKLGVRFRSQFSPIRPAALALILTAVRTLRASIMRVIISLT